MRLALGYGYCATKTYQILTYPNNISVNTEHKMLIVK